METSDLEGKQLANYNYYNMKKTAHELAFIKLILS